VAYLFYGGMAALDFVIAWLLFQEKPLGSTLGLARGVIGVVTAVTYYFTVGDFYAACFLLATSGMLVLLITQNTGWVINYPAAFWLAIFFVLPNLIVLAVSLGERSLSGTVVYPEFSLRNLGSYFDDYGRFFSTINGQYLYLRILGRSVWLALLNTALCLLFGFPLAYWIARQPANRPQHVDLPGHDSVLDQLSGAHLRLDAHPARLRANQQRLDGQHPRSWLWVCRATGPVHLAGRGDEPGRCRCSTTSARC
jgi:hypothetical protein